MLREVLSYYSLQSFSKKSLQNSEIVAIRFKPNFGLEIIDHMSIRDTIGAVRITFTSLTAS